MIKEEENHYNYADAASARTHPAPNKDSRFYQKFKSEFSLNNPTTVYRKHRKRLLAK